jgi:hypothetical protein
VINLSLGRPVLESYRFDPLCRAAGAAWRAGIVVVTAAGNLRRNSYATILSPANDPYVVTVGAIQPSRPHGEQRSPEVPQPGVRRLPGNQRSREWRKIGLIYIIAFSQVTILFLYACQKGFASHGPTPCGAPSTVNNSQEFLYSFSFSHMRTDCS